jgi:HemK-related putative methylase
MIAATPTVEFAFACPKCRTPLDIVTPEIVRCSIDNTHYVREDGIWRFLPPQRAAHYAQFLREYETVREAEGRGAADSAYYQALPFKDLTGHHTENWRIRATSFQMLVKKVIEPREMRSHMPLLIADVGAGNGWLAARLSQRGHQVAAIDITVSAADGLGAHVHHIASFVPIQAEFDHLPFENHQLDLVIFNASFHYSTQYEATLHEALRVLRPDGQIVILDSPLYRNAASGAQMVREREAQFTRQYGFASNALPNENYLTYRRLDELAHALDLQWDITTPFYGLRWALRPWRARLRGHREPAAFGVIIGMQGTGNREQGTGNREQGLLAGGKQSPVHPFTRSPAHPLTRSPRHPVTRSLWRRTLHLYNRLTQMRRYNRLALEWVAGRPILVLPQVFNPKLLRTGAFFVQQFGAHLILPSGSVLDMGTGSGVGAIVAASWARRVVAVDINPEAVRCARINALLNRVEARVDVREGDLFDPVQGERFDVILFNPPFFRGRPGGYLDYAWRSDDTVERFAAGLRDHLTPRGCALVILSTDGDHDTFLQSFRSHGFTVEVVAERDLVNEVLTVYRLGVKG